MTTDQTALRATLRQQLRDKRRALSTRQQHQAACHLDQRVYRQGFMHRYQHIAFYLANDGEIDPALLLKRALSMGKRCYLPVLAPDQGLWFVRYRRGDKLKANRFGILEPAQIQPRIKPWALNLVMLPLVGFDNSGGRLGMGGGFYDRSFNGIKHNPKMHWPHLMGLAHHCQQVAELPLASWDIPLSSIATDQQLIVTNTHRD